jgi:uncharacterized membrane protein YdbT with pleckstrin-like domain
MSSYIEDSLIKDEKIEYRAHISLWSLAPLILIGIILLFSFFIGIICFVMAFIQYKSTEIAITNKRIIAKFGFISRRTIEINLPKVESVQVGQGVLGRMFNYGSLIISGAGSPKALIPGIANPMEFRKTFNQMVEDANKELNSVRS